MRSRYSAYAKGLGDYVFRTWHPRTRPDDVMVDADVAAATKMTDLSTSTVKDSLSACGGPEEWKASADVDEIGDQIGHLGDMNGQSLNSSAALDLLCDRFDNSNSTDTCKGR